MGGACSTSVAPPQQGGATRSWAGNCMHQALEFATEEDIKTAIKAVKVRHGLFFSGRQEACVACTRACVAMRGHTNRLRGSDGAVACSAWSSSARCSQRNAVTTLFRSVAPTLLTPPPAARLSATLRRERRCGRTDVGRRPGGHSPRGCGTARGQEG